MEQSEIIKLLSSNNIEKIAAQTSPKTYSIINKGGLTAEQVTNRNSAGWKKAEFIIAYYEDKIDNALCIDGWKRLASITGDQILCLETEKGTWVCYDCDGNEIPFKSIFSPKESKISTVLQQIYYGAPGTGKSFEIDRLTSIVNKDNIIRTTFHPDSDYSTFVGCYKPTKQNADSKILDYTALVAKFKEYIKLYENQHVVCTMFGYDFHDSIVAMEPEHNIPQMITDAGMTCSSYDTVVRSGMRVYENHKPNSNSITYAFTPQAFTNAYIKAWQLYSSDNQNEDKRVYLIIEEINRGNCAQIFGDLFQLLDRGGNGFSDYPIVPDTDLSAYIQEKGGLKVSGVHDKHGNDISDDINNGKLLVLPDNLYIWATMNTSDQSLFPMDSAFKRRWDWKYMPIEQGVDKDTNEPLTWAVQAGETQYDWWEFLQGINTVIDDITHSEDKQLGFFFCKADDEGVISAEKFVNKVVFYLWNDVFKIYGFRSEVFNKDEAGKGKIKFKDFYSGMEVNTTTVETFIKNVIDKFKKENKKETATGADEGTKPETGEGETAETGEGTDE